MRALIYPRRLPVALRWFSTHGRDRNLPAPPKSFPALYVELSARPGPPCPETIQGDDHGRQEVDPRGPAFCIRRREQGTGLRPGLRADEQRAEATAPTAELG